MKITKIEPFVLYAQDTTEGMTKEKNVGGYTGYQVVVRIDTDEGVEGWGEACTGSEYGESSEATRVLIDKGLAPRITGENPLEYRRIWEKLYTGTEWFGRRGITIYALSAIDTALVDIAGKSLGVPAHILMGGRFRKEVPLYASLLFDMDDPEGTAKKGLRYIQQGYVGAKFGWGMLPERPFGANVEEDDRMVETIRRILGPKAWIMVDVGRYVRLSVQRAMQLAKRLEKHNIFWFEEALPQDDIDGFVQLTQSVDTTVAAGEGYYTIYDFKDLISRRAVDLLQPDVSKVGGLSEAKRIADLANIHNTMWVPHNWSTAINTAASLQLVAATPDAFLLEFKQEPNPLVNDLVKDGFKIKNGRMQVPDTPGLGIEINRDQVEKYAVKVRPI